MMEEHRSEEIKAIALENGWKAEVIPDLSRFTGDPDHIRWNVYAKRGNEALHLVYRGDRQYSCSYSNDTLRLHPARRAGVVRILTAEPEPEKTVPFAQDAPALEIMLAVMDKTVVWTRRIDGKEREEFVPKDTNSKSKHFRVYSNPKGDRFLEWTNVTGFHAVRLDSIVSVD